jgi:transcriptional regulator with XRE-family HTH domain
MPTEDFKRLGSRLRAARRARGLSLSEVASATDMSASFLSHVENGKGDITFMRLRRLVALYGMQLVDLVAAPHPVDERVVRASERTDIRDDRDDLSVYLLAPDSKRSMMPILGVWARGANSAEPMRIESEEFLHVVHGALQISFEDGEEIRLAEGDSIYLIEPHRRRTYSNVSRGRTVTLSVVSPPALGKP